MVMSRTRLRSEPVPWPAASFAGAIVTLLIVAFGVPVAAAAQPSVSESARAHDLGVTAAEASDQVGGAAAEFSFTFIAETSGSEATPWTQEELAVLRSWTDPGSPQLAAVRQVVGRPQVATTINIVHRLDDDGSYDSGSQTMALAQPRMSVFLHEMNHAVQGRYQLRGVWAEGMARAAEVEEMGILARAGFTEPTYQYYNHGSPFATNYDFENVVGLGPAAGMIWGNSLSALTLTRYEVAGYAFGKLLIENPAVLRDFNAALFSVDPELWLSQPMMIDVLAGVQPLVESTPIRGWIQRQQIFDDAAKFGCQLLQRPTELVVIPVCHSADQEVAQPGARVRLQIYDDRGLRLFNATESVGDWGGAQFSWNARGTYGRLRLVATVISGAKAPESVYYISDLPGEQSGSGVYGVVTNSSTGSVTITSPEGAFNPVTVPVTAGGFHAAGLRSVRGPVEVSYTGGGLTASKLFTKDSSGYGVALTGTPTAVTCTAPGAPVRAVRAQGGLTDDGAVGTDVRVPVSITWAAPKGEGCSPELQQQREDGTWAKVAAAQPYTTQAQVGVIPAIRVRVFDPSGKPTARALAIMSTVDAYQESGATFSGSWTVRTSPLDWGGSSRSSTKNGASVTLRFTGASIGVVGRTGSGAGQVAVYLDGTQIGTAQNFSPGPTQYRRVLAQWSGSAGPHTLKVVNLATAGHPAVTVDGFVSIR